MLRFMTAGLFDGEARDSDGDTVAVRMIVNNTLLNARAFAVCVEVAPLPTAPRRRKRP